MDDLLNNFAHQKIESPTEIKYIYHFTDVKSEGSEHEMPRQPAAEASNTDPFFHIEAADSAQATAGKNEDEADYNADIDDDDDDDYEFRRNATSRLGAYHHDMNIKSEDPNRALHFQDYSNLEMHTVGTKVPNGTLELSVAPSDDEQVVDGLTQHLRRLHRQDSERDELVTRLYQENLDLKRALKENTPGSNSRAEAAERSLFEIRKTLSLNPYVCVLVDAKGYKIHENLLQLGKKGGIEAASRLWDEVSKHLRQFGDAKSWEIMVHLYIDIGGLLARCDSNDIPLSDSSVRGFMLGFTQAQPLFNIVDVGHEQDKMSQKVEAMFHILANNVQCKHLIFGCCHSSAYAVALEKYACNPIAASSITLIKAYETNPFFEGLPFDRVEFPSVFRSTPYKETDRLAEDLDYLQDVPQQTSSDRMTTKAKKVREKEVDEKKEAITRWQATAGAPLIIPSPARTPVTTQSGWATEKNILLNIYDERVDRELAEVDHETSESMLDRIEIQNFCDFYHLQGSCMALSVGKPCNFMHGPRLNDDELRFLKKRSRRRPCIHGSRCRKADCHYGHVCPDQPGCSRGPKCSLYRFHEVDKVAVRVLVPGKALSPRKKG